jgi:hypothetical protein
MVRSFPGGHAEVVFEDCRVSTDAVLGCVHEGFAHAQTRLAPARLTQCMRWLGLALARRALDLALDRASRRKAFGAKLGDLGMVQQYIADSVIDVQTSRLLIWHCAWLLDQRAPARHESSAAKAHVAEAVHRVVDRAIQICGSLSVSGDTPLARYLTELTPVQDLRRPDRDAQVGDRAARASRAVRCRPMTARGHNDDVAVDAHVASRSSPASADHPRRRHSVPRCARSGSRAGDGGADRRRALDHHVPRDPRRRDVRPAPRAAPTVPSVEPRGTARGTHPGGTASRRRQGA